jgi:hypothetical protein
MKGFSSMSPGRRGFMEAIDHWYYRYPAAWNC